MPLVVAADSALRLLEGHIDALLILDGGLSAQTVSTLRSISLRRGIRTIIYPYRPPSDLPTTPHLPLSTYLRAALDAAIPECIDRVVFLDADTVSVKDLSALVSMDLRKHTVAAVRDASIATLGVSPVAELCRRASSPYFNAGVLVIDVGQWRNECIGQKVLELAAEHPSCMDNADQDAMNIVLEGRWLDLEARWNTQIGSAASTRDAAILHYTGGFKPWRRVILRGGWLHYARSVYRSGHLSKTQYIVWLMRVTKTSIVVRWPWGLSSR